MYTILLDTEGLNAPSASKDHDARIFSMALLLASVLVYNTQHVIKEDSISTLGFVTRLTQHLDMGDTDVIAAEGAAGASAGQGFLPSLLWLVRDFALQLKSADGEATTPNEYLAEHLDKVRSGYTAEALEANAFRAALKMYFPHRSCVTLPIPSTDEATLCRLQDEPLSALNPAFAEGMRGMRASLLGQGPDPLSRIKAVQGVPLSGRMLVALLQRYVTAANSGQVPSLGDAWSSAAHAQCKQAAQAAEDALQRAADDLASSLPLLTHELYTRLLDIRRQVLTQYVQAVQVLARSSGALLPRHEWAPTTEGGPMAPTLLPPLRPDAAQRMLRAVQAAYAGAGGQVGPEALEVFEATPPSTGATAGAGAASEAVEADPAKLCLQFMRQVQDAVQDAAWRVFRTNVTAAHAAVRAAVNEALAAGDMGPAAQRAVRSAVQGKVDSMVLHAHLMVRLHGTLEDRVASVQKAHSAEVQGVTKAGQERVAAAIRGQAAARAANAALASKARNLQDKAAAQQSSVGETRAAAAALRAQAEAARAEAKSLAGQAEEVDMTPLAEAKARLQRLHEQEAALKAQIAEMDEGAPCTAPPPAPPQVPVLRGQSSAKIKLQLQKRPQ